MQYQVVDSRFVSDNETNVMFAANDKEEAILVADDMDSGTVVVRIDESGLKEIVYTSEYKSGLGMIE